MVEEEVDTQSPAAPDENDVIARMMRYKRESEAHLAEWRKEARQAYDFVAGHQWSEEEESELTSILRAPVVFNRIGPVIDAVSGSEIANRQQVAYIPRRVGASGVNELLTGAADYIRDNCDAEDEESEAFLDAAICGIGCVETMLDEESSIEVQVKMERRDMFEMSWDPNARRKNLNDREWVRRCVPMKKADVIARWPDKKDDIEAAFWDAETSDPRDDREPHDAQSAWKYENGRGYDRKTGMMLVEHAQWREREAYWRALDPSTGQIVEMDDAGMERVRGRRKELEKAGVFPPGAQYQEVRRNRVVIKQAFVIGKTLLEEGDAPIKDDFSYKFITAKRDRNKNRWYGLVRSMVDPQRWANKFFSQLLHIIGSNAKGGLMAEEGATSNWRKLEQDWAKADSIVKLNDGALSKGKIMPKPPTPFPAEINHLLSFAVQSLRDTSGVNLEMLGLADREQPGILEAQRKQAALVVLGTIFDALRRYRKEQGRLLAKFIRTYLSDGRLVRIQQGNGLEQYVPLVRDAVSFEYDVVVDEAPTSQNTKERTFAILMQLMPALTKMGVPMPPDVMDYLPLPTGFVEKWKQTVMQAQQQPKPPDPKLIEVGVKQEEVALKRDQMQQQAADKHADRQLEWANLLLDAQRERARAFNPMGGRQ